jgi:ribulose 1,5-bisphosphate synthetase/thiazole synthase
MCYVLADLLCVDMILAQIYPGSACISRRRSLRSSAHLYVDVAVVGGGPAGLAAAAALQVATAGRSSVHVFERSAMKARGAAIVVGVNGLKALHAISPALLDTLLANAIQLEGAGGGHAGCSPQHAAGHACTPATAHVKLTC